MSTWRICILLHGSQSSADSPRTRIPRKCVNHSHKLHPLVLLCQQRRHFVSKKPSVRISAQKVRSMALFLADQLNVMCGKFTYTGPVLTHCGWVGEAQCIKRYQILLKGNKIKKRQSYKRREKLDMNKNKLHQS